MKNKEIENSIRELESRELRIKEIFKVINNKSTYPFDILSNAILDRTVHLIFGFTTLIRDENFMAASHLVRCHLDNILRYSAAWLVDNPQDFAMKVLGGKRIDEIKDRNGKYLKDYYLRDKLKESYPWITNVYKETSGFIHFSNKHIFASSRIIENEEKIVEFRISRKDVYVKDESRVEAIKCMTEITDILCNFIESWLRIKNNINEE